MIGNPQFRFDQNAGHPGRGGDATASINRQVRNATRASGYSSAELQECVVMPDADGNLMLAHVDVMLDDAGALGGTGPHSAPGPGGGAGAAGSGSAGVG